MTEPEHPAASPPPAPGPTPEEISARLEALLKRTHAMRVQQAGAGPSSPMTWPPSARELDHFDVVDVPADQRLQSSSRSAEGGSRPAVAPAAASSFERPDWGELRLRGHADEPPGVSRWWQVLTVALALVAAAQGAYIWSLQNSTPADATTALLRVDGPAGAEVRVDGQRLGPAPIEHTLAPGDYDVEIVHGGTATRLQRVAVSAGRTTVLLTPPGAGPDAPTIASPLVAAPTGSAPPAGGPTRTPAAAARPGSPGVDGVSPTLGAVLIESTPAGLPVTMEGRERGVTPITIGRLKPGRHDVLVGGLARQVDVTANTVATLRVTRQ